jgi:hypothetical protein
MTCDNELTGIDQAERKRHRRHSGARYNCRCTDLEVGKRSGEMIPRGISRPGVIVRALVSEAVE